MSKEKNKNRKNDKKIPAKNLKEKRAEKVAKRTVKSNVIELFGQ